MDTTLQSVRPPRPTFAELFTPKLVTILRDAMVYTPDPEQPIEIGDALLFVAAPEAESELEQLLNPH